VVKKLSRFAHDAIFRFWVFGYLKQNSLDNWLSTELPLLGIFEEHRARKKELEAVVYSVQDKTCKLWPD